MHRSLIIFLFLFSVISNAATFQQAQAVYNKIIIDNGLHGPILVLNSSNEVNADETDQRISINRGMLRFVHNSSELALVLGHELGHFTLHHQSSTVAHEYAADHQGAIYASHAGYSVCLGAQVFKRFPPVSPNSDHPDNYDRIKHLGCD